MDTDFNILYANIISIPLITFLVTVILKGIGAKIKNGEWSIDEAIGSGGMPSIHSSVVVSLATAIGIKHGLCSDYFAITMIFTAIVLYDSINVRYEAGQHARALNKSLGKNKFKESLGHLPSEAFAGSILGIIIAVIIYVI